jgi:aryl-alcohol dehydrogenase-like predicted oxidoreductase
MAAWQFAKAQATAERHGWTRFVSMQDRYNLLDRDEEREMIPLCRDQGVAVLPYSPLARGLLAGTRGSGTERRTTRSRSDPIQDELYGRPEDAEAIVRVVELAGRLGVPPAQVALAWLLHRQDVTAPIVGATRTEHIEDAVAAAKLELGADDLRRLEEPYRSRWIENLPSESGSGDEPCRS